MNKNILIEKSKYGWVMIAFNSSCGYEKASGSEVYNPFINIRNFIKDLENGVDSIWEINEESHIFKVIAITRGSLLKIKLYRDDKLISDGRFILKNKFINDLKSELKYFKDNDEDFESFYFV